MDPYAKLRERKSGEIQYYYKWRRLWEQARESGELAGRGWPNSWEAFERRIVPCADTAICGPKLRKRRPGGGRKPKPDKLRVRQICLTLEQCEAVKLAARSAGISQSAWIREAITARLA